LMVDLVEFRVRLILVAVVWLLRVSLVVGGVLFSLVLCMCVVG
jgi:hypothetical protein